MQKLLVLGVLLAIAAGIIGFRYSLGTPQANTIPVGGIMILSGQGASWGEASRNGMELAIADINRAGGVNGKQLKAVIEDDGSDPQKAVSAFNKLTSVDEVKFIIGPNWSNTGDAVSPLVPTAHVVMISPSLGDAAFNESSPYIFNTWQHDDILSAKLGDIVYDKGYHTVALFGANDVWVKIQTAAFTKEFTARGGRIVLTYEPTTDTTDERATVAKAVGDKSVQAIVMTTDGTNLSTITPREVRELGSKLPLFNITVDKQILADCGASCDGMLFPTSLTPTPAFEAEYEAAYGGRKVEIGADSAYDAVMMIAEAMRATGSEDPDKIKDYLAGIKTYAGVSGNLTSDGKRGFTKPYVLEQVESGVPSQVSR